MRIVSVFFGELQGVQTTGRRDATVRVCEGRPEHAAVGAGQPHFEFRLGWSGLTARAAESMGARLVIDELTVASRRPVVCTLQLPEVSAAAEGQERDLEEGFTDPQRRPQGDQGAGSM